MLKFNLFSRLGIEGDRKTWTRIFLICFLVYFFSAKGYLEVLDTSYSLQTAESMVTRGDLSIQHQYGFAMQGPNGLSYSKYGIGLPLYFVPWVLAGHGLSAWTGLPESEITGFLISFANIPVALLTLLVFIKLLQFFKIGQKNSYLITIALGLGTLVWVYAVSDFSEQLQMLLLLVAVYGVLKGTPKALTFAGVGFGLLILVKLIHVVLLPAFGLYLLLKPGEVLLQRVIRVLWFSWPIWLTIIILAAFNAYRFGNLLESGYGTESSEFYPSQMRYSIPELLISFNKGLLVFSPVLILSLLGWWRFFRQYAWEASFFMTLVLMNLLFMGSWWAWNGGWCWGPRLLVPLIPLWLLPLAFWLHSILRLRIAMLVIIVSIVAQLPGVLIKMQQVPAIKDRVYTVKEYPFAPSDYKAAWIFLLHKLNNTEEVYSVSDFGIEGNREFNFKEYDTYQGFNIWTEQMARHFNKPFIRWLLLPGVLMVLYLLAALIRGQISNK